MKTNFPNIEGYEIFSLLGQGGMGSVFLAKEKSSSRQVAIKVIGGSIASSTANEAVVRFKREIKVCASFAHPYVTKIYDGGVQSDGSLYLVMEYIQGKSLLEKVADQLLKEPEVRALALKMCEALSYVHAQEIFHRDIKPANIIYLSEERSILVDFGLAFPTDMTRLTETGNTVGTLQTMAPEQLQGKDVTAASDIYSLGATLYYCVTGHYPFNQENIIAMAAGVQQKTIPWAADSNPRLSDSFCKILNKCLQSNPLDRFQSAQQLARALVGKIEEEPAATSKKAIAPVEQPESSRPKSALALIIMLLILLPLGAKLYFARQSAEQAKQLVLIRQQLIKDGATPAEERCRQFGSLLISSGDASQTPMVDSAAIGLSELLFDALQEERHKRSTQLTMLFIKRHGLSWYESGRALPAEEIALSAFRANKCLPLAKALAALMKSAKGDETKLAIVPLLHGVCRNLSRIASMNRRWHRLQIEARKIVPILKPLLKKAKTAKARQLVALALFCAYRIDLSEQARDEALELLARLCVKDFQVVDFPAIILAGVTAMTKSAPKEMEVVPTRFRRAAIPFIKRAQNLVTERDRKFQFLFMLVSQYNAIGRQREALDALEKHALRDTDTSKNKLTYYNKKASLNLMLRRYKEAQKACEQALKHAHKKVDIKHLKDRLLNIKSLALVEKYE